MAQDSWTTDTEEAVHAPEAPLPCANNCGFYGHPMTNNLCSKCYAASILTPMLQKVTEVASSSSTSLEPVSKDSSNSDGISATNADEKQQEEPPKPPTNRCLMCRKKVGLTGFNCRCGGTFCSAHRYSDTHECSFDYKQAGREMLAKQNPVVMAAKINKI